PLSHAELEKVVLVGVLECEQVDPGLLVLGKTEVAAAKRGNENLLPGVAIESERAIGAGLDVDLAGQGPQHALRDGLARTVRTDGDEIGR
nr:hypothetical protein [Tanacetum cinerariifolium]